MRTKSSTFRDGTLGSGLRRGNILSDLCRRLHQIDTRIVSRRCWKLAQYFQSSEGVFRFQLILSPCKVQSIFETVRVQLEKRTINLHGLRPVAQQFPVRSLDQQLLSLWEVSRKVQSALGLFPGFRSVSQMGPGVGQSGIGKWILGVRSNRLNQQVPSGNEIEIPQFCFSL